MSASSLNRKVAEVQKAKKVERRHALEKRQQPEVDQRQHQEIEVGGVSSEASSGDSVVNGGKVKAKPATKKAAPKKEGSRKEKIRAALFLAFLLLLGHKGSWELGNG